MTDDRRRARSVEARVNYARTALRHERQAALERIGEWCYDDGVRDERARLVAWIEGYAVMWEHPVCDTLRSVARSLGDEVHVPPPAKPPHPEPLRTYLELEAIMMRLDEAGALPDTAETLRDALDHVWREQLSPEDLAFLDRRTPSTEAP